MFVSAKELEVPIAVEGFEWQPKPPRAAHDRSPALAPRLGPIRYYVPAKEPVALYRELAQTEQTKEGVLGFANRYGRLKGWPERETLAEWIAQMGWLREMVAIWDMVQQHDLRALGEVFVWRPRCVYYRGTPEMRAWPHQAEGAFQSDASNAYLDQIMDLVDKSLISKGDLIHPATIWVLANVSANMRRYNGPALVWDPRRKQIVWQDISINLLGFIWLQFGQAVCARKQPRRCSVCGRWFDVSHGGNRTDRETCSNTCRTRVYRQRQERAREMRVEGKHVRAIAKELGSDLETVKRWLATGRD
jgi:hypothetical protein